MKILFDGDILTYRSGFVAESKLYYVLSSHSDTENRLFFSKKDANKYLATITDATLTEELIVQPLATSLSVFKKMIKSVLDRFGTDQYLVYLTDSKIQSNFRYAIDSSYKANRKKSVKPKHYEAIRKYALNKHPTMLISGQEADDALGIEQCSRKEETIIASIDKDLLMIPGNHINLNSMEVILASDPGKLTLGKGLKGTGFKWFAAQLLLGDAVDNIPGLKGFGPVHTFKLLDKCKTQVDIWDAVKTVYKDDEALDRNASLLWIRREEGQTYKDYLNGL